MIPDQISPSIQIKMRKQIAAGNWKMNTTAEEARSLATEIRDLYQAEVHKDVEVIFAPPYVHLEGIARLLSGSPRFHVAGQNLHQEDSGAYTGEVSGAMLRSVGCSHVIIGHSERREYFHEDNALLAAKVRKALAVGLAPIYCFGESLAQREAGETFSVVESQVREGVLGLPASDFGKVILAYEPIWAIGTGVTASPEQAQEVHAYLRGLLSAHYGAEVANDCSILYGGSVKPGNAATLFGQADIDGGLVGGASLKSRDFVDIIRAFPAR